MISKKQKLGTKRGVSLIIALVLITVIAAFSLGVSAMVISAIRQTAAVNNSNMAYYAAEGALEMGLLANSVNGAGFSDSKVVSGVKSGCKLGDVVADCCADNDPLCTSIVGKCSQKGSSDQNGFNACISAELAAHQQKISSEYTISGQVPATKKLGNVSNYAGMYTIPAPGTGNAGKDCDPLKANFDKKFNYQYYSSLSANAPTVGGDVVPEDDACNWNKLKVGETASIPLFVANPSFQATADSPAGIKNPKDLGLDKIFIRVRTPCEDDRNVMCPGPARFTLDAKVNKTAQFWGDDPVMSWQITGGDMDNGTSYTLNQYVAFNNDINKPSPGWNNTVSSAIRESMINTNQGLAYRFEVFDGSSKFGIDLNNNLGTPISFIDNMNYKKSLSNLESQKWEDRHINKPVLKLSVIHSLDDLNNKSNKVPFLEYQIIINVNNYPPTDGAQTIIGEAIVGGYKAVVQSTLGQNNSITDYVVQQ